MTLLLLALLQAPLSGRWDGFRVRHDALHYDVTLILPDTGTLLRAEVTTRWKLGGAGPLLLDLDDAHTVRSASVNGAPVAWRRVGDRIELPVQGPTGALVTSTLSYDGHPIAGFFIKDSAGVRTIFADNWPNRAHLWLASVDHPADKASVAFHVLAPVGYGVVATGKLVSVDKVPPDHIRWHFENPEPVPVYTMVIGMARFAVTRLPEACAVRCVPVSVYSYPADSAFALEGPFRRAHEMVDLFSRRFGAFPYGELRHVESSTAYGGMENSTAIFYDERAWRAHRTPESVVAHETAHQWFGDAVTEADWHHVWLSEGFATYGAALWAEQIGGDSALRATMLAAKDRIIRRAEVTDRPMLDSSVTNPSLLLNTNSYEKGSWVLHSLRGLVGDSAFFRGVAQYYRTYQHQNALSSDFARVMGQAARQDLSWFFRQSLTQPGYPILEVKSILTGGRLLLTIRQVQKRQWGLYRIPNLRVRLDDRVVTVALRGAVTRFATRWEGAAPPGRVTLDPEGWWLLKVNGER